MTIVLTNHARERMKKRTNYSPTRAKQIAEEAYYCGKSVSDFKGKMKRYLENVLQASSGDELRVLGNDIYLFGNGCLITIFPFPNKVISNNAEGGEHGKSKKHI